MTTFKNRMNRVHIFPVRKELTSFTHKFTTRGGYDYGNTLFINLGPVELRTARKLLKEYKRKGIDHFRARGSMAAVLEQLELLSSASSTFTAHGEQFVIYELDYLGSTMPKELISYVSFTYPQEGTHYKERRHWGLVRAFNGDTLRLRKAHGSRNYRFENLTLLHPSGFHRVDSVDSRTLARPEIMLVCRFKDLAGNHSALEIEIGELQKNGTIRTGEYLYEPRRYESYD